MGHVSIPEPITIKGRGHARGVSQSGPALGIWSGAAPPPLMVIVRMSEKGKWMQEPIQECPSHSGDGVQGSSRRSLSEAHTSSPSSGQGEGSLRSGWEPDQSQQVRVTSQPCELAGLLTSGTPGLCLGKCDNLENIGSRIYFTLSIHSWMPSPPVKAVF